MVEVDGKHLGSNGHSGGGSECSGLKVMEVEDGHLGLNEYNGGRK